MHKCNKIFCLLLMPALSLTAMAQETEEKKITVSGSIRATSLFRKTMKQLAPKKLMNGL